ncbi:hypothetical protein Tco_0488872 [Tanacetum coccineum]
MLSVNEEISRYCSDNLYAVSIKEDKTYLCLHFIRNHEELKSNTPYLEDSIRCSIKEVVTETMTEPTFGEYREEVRADYGSNTTTPGFNKNVKFELGGDFLKILRDNAFNKWR